MNKRMKIILSVILLLTIMFSEVVWASSNIYSGIIQAMSLGSYSLFGDDDEEPEEPSASQENEAWNLGYDAGYNAAIAGNAVILPERRRNREFKILSNRLLNRLFNRIILKSRIWG